MGSSRSTALKLKNDLLLDHEIKTVSALDQNALIVNGQILPCLLYSQCIRAFS